MLRLLLAAAIAAATPAASAAGFVFHPPLASRFDIRTAPPAARTVASCRSGPSLTCPTNSLHHSRAPSLPSKRMSTPWWTPKLPRRSPAGVAFQGKLIWYHGAGKTKKTWFGAKKPTADTKYRIGSVSKVFPVLQAYMLHDQGKLYLDQTLAGLGSVRFDSKFGQRQQPTIRELASAAGRTAPRASRRPVSRRLLPSECDQRAGDRRH